MGLRRVRRAVAFENYLYTTQAIQAYYDHLTDDGVLAIMRWDMDIPRLVTNTVSFLGVNEAAKRIVAVIESATRLTIRRR